MMKGLNLRLGAVNKGGGAFKSFNAGLNSVKKSQQAVVKSNVGFMKGMSANRRVVQQVGMQVSDLGVQIAGGQSALLSLTQNVPQVVQMFGAWGGILAAVITLLGTLTLVLVRSKVSFEDIAEYMGATTGEFKAFANAVVWVRDRVYDMINLIMNNLDALTLAVTVFAFKALTVYIFKMNLATAATAGLSKAVLMLTGVLKRTGIMAAYLAVGYLIAGFIDLTRAIGSLSKATDLAMTAFKEGFMALPKFLVGFLHKFNAFNYRMTSSFQLAIAEITASMPDWVNDMLGTFVGLSEGIQELWFTMTVAIQNLMIDALNTVIRAVPQALNKIIEGINALPGVDLKPINVEDLGLDHVEKRGGELMDRLADRWEAALDGDYVGGISNAFKQTAVSMGLAADQADMLGDKMFSAANDAMPAWKEIKALMSSMGSDFDIADIIEQMNALKEGKGFKEMKEMNIPELRIKKPDISPIKTDLMKEWEQFGKELSSTMSGAFKNIMKGTGDFGDFFSATLDKIRDRLFDLAFDPVFDMLANALNNVLGGGQGGLGGGGILGSIFGGSGGAAGAGGPVGGGFGGFFAKGGTLGAGKIGIAGEDGPEFIYGGSTPLSVTSNKMSRAMSAGRGSGGGGSVVVNNVNNFNGVTREEVMADVMASQKMMKSQIERDFPSQAAKYQRNANRGFV